MEDPVIPAAVAQETPDSGEDGSESVLSPEPEKVKSLADRLARRLKAVEKERDALAAANAKAQESTLTETEREKSRADKAEAREAEQAAKFNQRLIRISLEAAMKTSGTRDPELAIKSIDMDSIEVDDDGNVTGIDAAIASLKKKHSILFGSPTVGSPGGNPANGAPGQISLQQLKGLKSSAEIKAAIESGRIKY